jgi:hypothetical protein
MGHRRRHCGIYLITHLPSGKLYVGKSFDLFMRWDSHLSNLLFDKHHNKHLCKRCLLRADTENGHFRF